MTGFGRMISFNLADGTEIQQMIFRKLKIISLAESLGGVESLICYPPEMTHVFYAGKQRISIGVTKDLVTTVGKEDVEDLIEDISSR